MYLKALEIQGFKSFPEKTCLTFDRDITAIVGPNGSGKSNIADAILWVMGEQRTKTLRGGKMEDVIFGGTERRGKLGYAQVTLVLDNSARLFGVKSDEIAITRRYYRSGESEYSINREPVRLKDVSELLMDTGLGRDGYSIIGQGRIDEIVSGRSVDRREIFEEAAGISRCRHRKEEAEHKLARTDENLQRVRDKIDELELQVGPLREQAETAKKYLLLRDELRSVEVSAWMETLDKLHAEAENAALASRQAEKALADARRELEELYGKSENIAEKMRECDVEAESERLKLSSAEAALNECENAAAVLRANIKNSFESVERLKSEMRDTASRAAELSGNIGERRARMEEIDARSGKLAGEERSLIEKARQNELGAGEAMREIAGLVAEEGIKSGELASLKAVMGMLEARKAELLERAGKLDGDLSEARRKLEETGAEGRKAAGALKEAREKTAGLGNVVSGRRMLISSRENAYKELSEKATKLTVECRSMDARIAMLTEMEKELEGYSGAVRAIVREAGRGALRGIRGPVAKLIKTDGRYALAVETALGGAMQHIVVDTQEEGRAAIELLKRRDAGRCTFLPIDVIKDRRRASAPTGEAGFVGIAADLTEREPRYNAIIEDLLGRTVVVETLSDAVRMSRKHDNALRIVTLDGQLVNAGGSMTGGSAARNTGILSRANELRGLTEERARGGAELEKCSSALAEAERTLNAAKYELEVSLAEQAEAAEEAHRMESEAARYELLLSGAEEALGALLTEKESSAHLIMETEARMRETEQGLEEVGERLEAVRAELNERSAGREELERSRRELMEKLSAIREDAASLAAEREATRLAAEQLETLRKGLAGDKEAREKAISEEEAGVSRLKEELAVKEERLAMLSGSVQNMKNRISELTSKRMGLEGERTKMEKSGQDKNRDLIELERRSAKLEQARLASDMEEKQILDRLWDTYELSRTAAQAVRLPLQSLSQANRRIAELKRGLGELGTPNLGAIEEFSRVSERYDFLTAQRDDVEKAKKDLLKVIADMTAEMKEIFTREFEAVNERFGKTFAELFGGGKASLELEDPENVLESGIEIKAQPPGKSLSVISLLSGGEKAYVAIALYFAIMKVRPTPFCVMDEIEAALDEANVARFAKYLRSMSHGTQFVVITHRRVTMEEADYIYGITMQEKGVSKVIELNVEEAEKASGE